MNTRRDFLKLLTLAPATLAARPLLARLGPNPASTAPNVLVFVFDAWSARHLKIHGYARPTMPNLERFIQRATVYHNHHSAGTFTVPGTASLLTSLNPWTHRAVQLSGGGVAPKHSEHHIFAALQETHASLGYAQNPFADAFLYQFRNHLETYIPEGQFNVERRRLSTLPIFQNDAQIAFASFENNIIRDGKGYSGSLFFGMAARFNALLRSARLRREYIRSYPKGLPLAGGTYFLNDVVDGTINTLEQIKSPTMAYFHFFPPHEPYTPTAEYADAFDDGWAPIQKPFHPLSRARHPLEEMLYYRLSYDQFMAAWDAEIGRLLDYLETSGLLDTSIVIFTSDHGELFERGEIGHNTMVISAPVTHVPLLISTPGQTQRKDVYAYTSSLDLLPTLTDLVGAPRPDWAEGVALPGLGGEEDASRSIFSIDAKMSSSFAAFGQYSIAMIKQGHRLIKYRYPNYTGFELYNLEEDPEEMKDLYPAGTSLGKQLEDELTQKVDEFNRPYER